MMHYGHANALRQVRVVCEKERVYLCIADSMVTCMFV